MRTTTNTLPTNDTPKRRLEDQMEDKRPKEPLQWDDEKPQLDWGNEQRAPQPTPTERK